VDDGELAATLELEQLTVSPLAGSKVVARRTVPAKPEPKPTLTVVEMDEPEAKLMFAGLIEIVNA